MAVSKRTRYEVLRRDSFTCRYCGASAPDVKLTVDHVMPVALGGGDDPANLVAACVDCNAGKASTRPDDETVAAAANDAERWVRAIALASEHMRARREELAHVEEAFTAAWTNFKTSDGEHVPLPADWSANLARYYAGGLTAPEIVEAVNIAMSRANVPNSAVYAYFCGVCKNKIEDLHRAARAFMEGGDV